MHVTLICIHMLQLSRMRCEDSNCLSTLMHFCAWKGKKAWTKTLLGIEKLWTPMSSIAHNNKNMFVRSWYKITPRKSSPCCILEVSCITRTSQTHERDSNCHAYNSYVCVIASHKARSYWHQECWKRYKRNIALHTGSLVDLLG